MEKKHLLDIKHTASETRSMVLTDLRSSRMKIDELNRQLKNVENRHTMEIEKLRTSHVLSLEELRSEAVREKDQALRSLKSSMNTSMINLSVSSVTKTPMRGGRSQMNSSATASNNTSHKGPAAVARERAKLLAAKIMRLKKTGRK